MAGRSVIRELGQFIMWEHCDEAVYHHRNAAEMHSPKSCLHKNPTQVINNIINWNMCLFYAATFIGARRATHWNIQTDHQRLRRWFNPRRERAHMFARLFVPFLNYNTGEPPWVDIWREHRFMEVSGYGTKANVESWNTNSWRFHCSSLFQQVEKSCSRQHFFSFWNCTCIFCLGYSWSGACLDWVLGESVYK